MAEGSLLSQEQALPRRADVLRSAGLLQVHGGA